jgi:hypothetical protein
MSAIIRSLLSYLLIVALEKKVFSAQEHQLHMTGTEMISVHAVAPKKMQLVLLPHDWDLPHGAVAVHLPGAPNEHDSISNGILISVSPAVHLESRGNMSDASRSLSASSLKQTSENWSFLYSTALATTALVALVIKVKRNRSVVSSPRPSKMEPAYDTLISPPDGYTYNTFTASEGLTWTGSHLDKFDV